MVGLTVDKATDDLVTASSVKTRVAMTYMGNGGSEAAITRAHGCGGVDDRLCGARLSPAHGEIERLAAAEAGTERPQQRCDELIGEDDGNGVAR
jgi:hypothetical protein